MQFTFSVDQPTSTASAVPVQKPDLKPSAEFKDNVTRRSRPITRSAATQEDTQADSANDKDTHHTSQHDLRDEEEDTIATTGACLQDALLRFPTLFSSDFGPPASALLFPTPTVTNPMNYGEGVRHSSPTSDSFDIIRPTIELPLDKILMETGDCSEAWPMPVYPSSASTTDSQSHGRQLELTTEMKSEAYEHQHPAFSQAHFARRASQQEQTVSPAKLGHSSETPPGPSSSRPTLSVRTQSAASRSSGPGASVTNALTILPPSGANLNNVPGGVKAECSNCGTTHAPLWRRGLNNEFNCNACGLYCKLVCAPHYEGLIAS